MIAPTRKKPDLSSEVGLFLYLSQKGIGGILELELNKKIHRVISMQKAPVQVDLCKTAEVGQQ
ncbi:hypothetical protein [Tumebacillus permanentifrigoris]|uniref:hypothetical protein n=1 Tax=Tumebacillus permanentifrigoris TaxID=378543 RepID=UPI0011B221E0|nr:hypothetical protein [Tumebacillus permanentifrigoris]